MASDLLNEAGHPNTTVLPLTTQLIDDAEPLRFRVKVLDSASAQRIQDSLAPQTQTSVTEQTMLVQYLEIVTDGVDATCTE